MFKLDRVLIAVIFLASFLIGLVFMTTVFDLGLFSEGGMSLSKPEEVPESFQGTVDGVVEELKEGWQRFRSEGYAFQIDFPQQVSKKSVLNQEALNAGLGMSPEAPVWEFELKDPAYSEDTNLLDASLVIHVLRDEEAVENCSAFKSRSKVSRDPDAPETPPVVEINGIPFWKDVVEEGVMGEIYTLISYRTAAKGACYELTQLIHARNPGVYEPGSITPYDKEAVIEELDEVLHTFQLLEVSPSFPKVIYPQPKSIYQPVQKSGNDQVDGLDVSHWQGDIHWPQVAGAGYSFTFVKATESVYWTDVRFEDNVTEGTAAGVKIGLYHFARPDHGTTGAEEAEYFITEVGDYLESGYLRPVLDLEVGKEFSKSEISAWVIDWMETVKERTGVEPMLYTNLYFINNYLTHEVTKYDLWMAYWSCEPEPTFDMPPTGKWADWSFWQYYGPSGCGYNAGYVPGIETAIDLNIFNGVESSLTEYDAASPLWVSLVSDTYLAPYPYYADITADVNGDTTGPVDYHFWWDCTALEADAAAVEETCGELPSPESGSCLDNENGSRCLGIESETQLGEHTYPVIGEFTPKVIVERGDAPPAEDRYKIITYNPLRYTSPDPASPAVGYIDEPFALRANARIQTSIGGALQVSLFEQDSGEMIGRECTSVGNDSRVTKRFNFSWPETALGQKAYTVWTRYRVEGSCPIEDEHEYDQSQTYVINWQEPPPVLELERPLGTGIIEGGVDDLGNQVTGEMIELTYVMDNPSPYSSINIQEITTANPVNVSDLSVDFSGPVEIPTESARTFTVSFQVDELAPFSFDLAVAHDAANASPYQITVQGSGVELPDPIQSLSVDPASPGTARIGDPFPLDVDLGLELPASGALQVSVVNQDTKDIEDRVCRTGVDAGQGGESFALSWSNAAAGDEDYKIWARFREGGSCPIEDAGDLDLSRSYLVTWEEDPPVLGLEKQDGTPLSSGSVVDLGEIPFYETVELAYVVRNTSTTSALNVSGVSAENLEDLSDVQISPAGSFEVGAGAEQTVQVSFLVENTGAFSFDLELSHDATNASPYTLSIQGSGVMEAAPIQSLTPLPAAPESLLIGDSFPLSVEVGLDIPAAGALQVRVLENSSGEIRDQVCQAVADELQATKTYSLSWTESAPGEVEYTVQARYQAGSGCPLEGAPDHKRAASYTIPWEEETPVLVLQRPAGTSLPTGHVDEIGEYEFYQTLELDYLVRNPSRTSSLEISEIAAENLSGLSKVEISPSGPLTLGPEEEMQISVSFRVENTGPFSFDLAFEHDGGNASPYGITVQGSGVMTENLIQFLTPDPLPPASALIGENFRLAVEVGVDAPDGGALQVQVSEKATGAVEDQACLVLVDQLKATHTISLSWSEAAPAQREYTIKARYQVGGECPFQGAHDAAASRSYQMTWREIAPVLEVQDQEERVLPAGSSREVGETPFGEEQTFTFVIHNPSPTTGMEVSSLSTAGAENLDALTLDVVGPVTLEPGGKRTITAAYRAENLGAYSFDLVLAHDASNGSPYRVTVEGRSVLAENPIQSLNADPASPGAAWMGETYTLQVDPVVEAPADSALLVRVVDEETGDVRTGQCMNIEGSGRATGSLELSWAETVPGQRDYILEGRYQVGGECPIGEAQDAVLRETYRVTWQEEEPVLVVKRPVEVTVDDLGVDYIGVHDWFGFVEATYILENTSRTTSLNVEQIYAENLFHLKRVKVTPSGPFELGPGERKTINVLFLVLTVDPYSLDLVIEHTGSNPGPYSFAVHGDGRMNLDKFDLDPKFHPQVEKLVSKGFFLQIPDFILDLLESYLDRGMAAE